MDHEHWNIPSITVNSASIKLGLIYKPWESFKRKLCKIKETLKLITVPRHEYHTRLLESPHGHQDQVYYMLQPQIYKIN